MATAKFKSTIRSKAQGMVELGLIMPILLLVIYGIFEVGRVAFMYSSVTSASREALRFGSSSGLNVLGGPVRFEDCEGIRSAVQNVDFMNVIDDSNIAISYDHGPGTGEFAVCPPTVTQHLKSGDRIVIQVSANFVPIIPIIPWAPWTITSTGTRTILFDIQVAGTIQPPQLATYTPSATWTRTNTPTSTSTPTYTPTVTDTPIFSPTPSDTPTITPTPTATKTSTNTPTPTHTSLPTATFLPTATKFVCNVKHSGPIASGSDVTWTIYNNHTIPVDANFLIVYWDSNGSRFLTNVYINGESIFYGTSKYSPMMFMGSWSLPGASIPPGISTIRLVFTKETSRIRATLNLRPCSCASLDSSDRSQIQPAPGS